MNFLSPFIPAWRPTSSRTLHIRHSSLQSFSSQKQSIFEILDTSSQGRLKSLTFLPSAACQAKNINAKPLDFPKDMKMLSYSGGEDAYFVRPDSIGVADGVGGWVSVKGANSALYSRMLMHYSALEFQNFDTPDFDADPLPLVGRSFPY